MTVLEEVSLKRTMVRGLGRRPKPRQVRGRGDEEFPAVLVKRCEARQKRSAGGSPPHGRKLQRYDWNPD
eukprot:10535676-Heterocapsa_arctica.AAC.1